MMETHLIGEYEPYHDDCAPEDHANFVSAEDDGAIEDLAEGREPCELCGGHLKPRGAFGAKVIFECLHCRELMSIEIEEWTRYDEDDDEDDDDEED